MSTLTAMPLHYALSRIDRNLDRHDIQPVLRASDEHERVRTQAGIDISIRSVARLDNEGALVNTRPTESEPLLTPAEVAAMFRVDPKTVTRWAKAGKLSSIRTLGGHRRYRESEVRELLAGIPTQRQPEA